MTDLNQLRERIEQLETEIEAVLSATERLRRAHRRKCAARLACSLFLVLLLGAYWSFAQTPPGDQIHAPFEVKSKGGETIFGVSNDHSFWLATEKNNATLFGTATETEYSFLVAPGGAGNFGSGPWVKLGLESSGSGAPAAPAPTAPPPAGGTGRGPAKGRGQARGGQSQGAGSDGSSPGMAPFVKLGKGSPYRQRESDVRILLETGESNMPALSVRNTDGVPVVLLLQSRAYQGGALGIQNSKGDLAVRGGCSAAGIGVVEAKPFGNPVGSTIVGRVR